MKCSRQSRSQWLRSVSGAVITDGRDWTSADQGRHVTFGESDLGKEADAFLSLKWLPGVRSHSVLQASWLYSRRCFLNVVCDVSACRSAHIYQRLTMC